MSTHTERRTLFHVFTDMHSTMLGDEVTASSSAPACCQYIHTNLGLGTFVVAKNGEATLRLDWPLNNEVSWDEVGWWEDLPAFMHRVRAHVKELDAQPFSAETQCTLMWASQALRRAERHVSQTVSTA